MELLLRNLLQFALIAIWALVLGRVILSWVDPGGRGMIATFLIRTTEPVLAPIRRFLPRTGMVDLSPFILLLVLSALWRAI